MHKDSKKRKPVLARNFETLENRQLLSATVSPLLAADKIKASTVQTILGYTPAQIDQAYGISSAKLSNGSAATGAGQTIAIIDAYNDPDIASDLGTFDSEFGLPAASLSVVSQTGSTTKLPATNAGWDLEISLDVEWAHAVAPQANILLVEANNDDTNNLMDAVMYARTVPGVSVVSMSWGGSESSSQTSYDSDFTTPTGHQGITFVAASGDDGSFGGVDWPASSSNVLAVGGTSLNLSSSGAYESETAWSDTTGGYSEVESELSYQSAVQTTGYRSTPDVSYDANPNTGVAVYDSVRYEGESGWQEIGGTSVGAPSWAGIIALADQDRAAGNLGTLNGTDQTLPTLYSEFSTSTDYADSFHDVGNDGYSLLTGLGSPKANVIVSDLFGATTTTPTVVPVPAPTQNSGGHHNNHGGGYGGGIWWFPYDQSIVHAAAASATIDQHIAITPLPNVSPSNGVFASAMASGDAAVMEPIASASVAAPPTVLPQSAFTSASGLIASASTAVAPPAIAATSVSQVEGVNQATLRMAAGLFSTTRLPSAGSPLFASLASEDESWSAALAAGVLIAAYIGQRPRQSTSGIHNNTPHHIFC
jgi:hypothetical protein